MLCNMIIKRYHIHFQLKACHIVLAINCILCRNSYFKPSIFTFRRYGSCICCFAVFPIRTILLPALIAAVIIVACCRYNNFIKSGIANRFFKFFRKSVFFSGFFIRVYISVIIDVIKHSSGNFCFVIFMITGINFFNCL